MDDDKADQDPTGGNPVDQNPAGEIPTGEESGDRAPGDRGAADRIGPGLDVDRLLDDHLTPLRTARLVALGGVGLTEFVLLTTLLLTEPTPLPVGTTVALSLIATAGLAWAAFAAWRLTTRQVLLLRDRVIGAAMSMTFSTIAAVGGTAIAADRADRPVSLAVAVAGATMMVAAAMLLRRALVDQRRARTRLAALTR